MKIWTAKDLLDSVSDFVSMVPNQKEWNEKSLRRNPPRLIRLKRIIALFNAFEIKSAFEPAEEDCITDEDGMENFLKSLDIKINENEFNPLTSEENRIYNFLEGYIKIDITSTDYPKTQAYIEEATDKKWDEVKNDLFIFYENLIKYRIEIDRALRHNIRFIEANGAGSKAGIQFVDDTNRELSKSLVRMDEILCEIINPRNLSFTQDILIRKYNFPTADLDVTDRDYF